MRSAAVSSVAVAVAVVVVVVVAAAGGYLLLSGSSPAPSSTTTTSSAQYSSTTTSSTSPFTTVTGNNSQVASQLGLFIQAFDNRQVNTLTSFYTSSSVVAWTGNTQGLGGTYTGSGNIEILYASSIGHTDRFAAHPSQVKMVATAPNVVNLTMHLDLNGSSSVLGKISATVNAQQQWANNGGSWVIQKENWNYLTFTAQNPSSSTVFPQWGLQLNGKSPNLSSEHNIEWAVAPYIALLVYILLAVAAIAVIFRSRNSTRSST
jgi:hypothetical protein